jgi:2-isopropylmalate synthase
MKETGIAQGARIHVVDCTLREGAQAPGVAFSTQATLDIARVLDGAGVGTIEVGHPCVSPVEFERVSRIASAGLRAIILAHARAAQRDVEAVARAGADAVGIFVGVNALSQAVRLRRDEAEILSMVDGSVRLARRLGLAVRLTIEDASRTPFPVLRRAYEVALDAGADRICFADSVGIMTPFEVRNRIDELRAFFPTTPLEVHFHDDRGLAMANALAAVAAGATHVSCSVNGMGERCGVTDTAGLAANLSYEGVESGMRLVAVASLSDLVAACTSSAPDARRPVTGRHAFRHTSRLHAIAIERDRSAYEWINPALLGFAETGDQLV